MSKAYILPLKVNVHFCLTNLDAAHSIAYFTSYCFRPPRRNKLYHYDLFMTRIDVSFVIFYTEKKKKL
jgi:hypothetical protein